MKNKNIILYLLGLLLLASCQDMFEPADENTRQEDAMKLESDYANGLLMYGYSSLPHLSSTQTDIATDDAVTNQTSSGLYNMATGTWAADANPTPINQWDACLGGVQYVNKFLSIVKETSWSPSAPKKQNMFVDRMKGEAFAIRAILYLSLLQAHGGYADDDVLYGVPLFVKPLDASSDFNMERATFAECLTQIYADCDSAMNLLPVDYKNYDSFSDIPSEFLEDKDYGREISAYNAVFGNSQTNRISGRIAMAVKAQAALLAASPAFRDGCGYKSPSDTAAVYCANVIMKNDGLKGFDTTGNVDWYSSAYKQAISANTHDEILWRIDTSDPDNSQEREHFPPSLYGNGRVNPSQNLVDAFPMNNGLPITDPESGYDPENPYANRDMRLANTVIYNGLKFRSNNILTGVEMGYGSEDNPEFDDNLEFGPRSTRTGYYLKKLLREDVSANPNSPGRQDHIYPRIRYTEIYLGFAEAANDAWGPTGNPRGYNFTAFDIIQAIRERAGIGKDEYGRPLPDGDKYLKRVKDNKELMTELIRNERRLELCFENKRFWDLRRWKMPLKCKIQGMKVERIDPSDKNSKLKYTLFNVEDREYDDSYQCYGPIPKGEVLKWSNLKQNKGWK